MIGFVGSVDIIATLGPEALERVFKNGVFRDIIGSLFVAGVIVCCHFAALQHHQCHDRIGVAQWGTDLCRHSDQKSQDSCGDAHWGVFMLLPMVGF